MAVASPSTTLEMTIGGEDGGGGNILADLVIVPIKCFEKGRDSVLFQEIPINRRKKHKKSLCQAVGTPKFLYTFIPLYLYTFI